MLKKGCLLIFQQLNAIKKYAGPEYEDIRKKLSFTIKRLEEIKVIAKLKR